MAEKFDLDTLLKEQGYDEWAKGQQPKSSSPTSGAMDYFTSGPGGEIIKAGAKGLGALALDVGELGVHALPRAWPEARTAGFQAVEKGREYTAPSEDEPWYATPFRWAGEYLPLGGIGRGVGGIRPLERMAAKVMPPYVPRFIPSPGMGLPSMFVNAATPAAKTAQAVTRHVGDPALTGGAIGAISDPDHPGQGFLHGLETGLALSGGEAALRGLGSIPRYLLTHYIAKGMGIPWHPGGHMLNWLASKAQRVMPSRTGKATERLEGPAARAVSKTLAGPPDEETEEERHPLKFTVPGRP